MGDNNQDFVARVVQMAGRKVGYAVERNIPQVLEDIKRQRELFGDGEEPGADRVDMTVKVSVFRPSENYARLEIDSVTWETKVRRKDNDFAAGEVDGNEPFLPGMDNTMAGDHEPASPPPPAITATLTLQTDDGAGQREKNLLDAAEDIGARVLRSCRDQNNPQQERIIEQWKDGQWQPTLCESAAACKDAAAAATSMGHLYIDGDDLDKESIHNLLSAGIDVGACYADGTVICDLDDKRSSEIKYNVNASHENKPPRFCTAAVYRRLGGVEYNIYRDLSKMTLRERYEEQVHVDAAAALDALHIGPDAADLAEAGVKPAEPEEEPAAAEELPAAEEPTAEELAKKKEEEKWELLLARAKNALQGLETVGEAILQRKLNVSRATAGNILRELQDLDIVGAPMMPHGHRKVIKPAAEEPAAAVSAEAGDAVNTWRQTWEENAKKLYAGGLSCYFLIPLDNPVVISSDSDSDTFAWREQVFASEDAAGRNIRELRKQGYVDVQIVQRDYDAIIAVGLRIIRKGYNARAGKIYRYTIRELRDNVWREIQVCDTEEECDEAMYDLLAAANVLES